MDNFLFYKTKSMNYKPLFLCCTATFYMFFSYVLHMQTILLMPFFEFCRKVFNSVTLV
jgi:hypothetical protein